MNGQEVKISNSSAEFLLFTAQSSGNAIEVRVQDNTVWLTQKLIAMLFDVERSVITKHLSNIYQEYELSKSATCAIFAQVQIEGNRQVARNVDFYNLDAIISVGYRVNSKYATAFRQWATSVLKDYMLKGYVVNQRIERLEHKIFEIETLVHKALPMEQGVFCDGQIFDAYAFVSKLIKSAKKSIILIDNYVDESVLLLLSKRKKKVSARILTARFTETLQQDLDKHNAQYPPIIIEKFTKSHDRFLILDNKKIYLIGASLKDLGKKWFGFSKMENDWILSQLP